MANMVTITEARFIELLRAQERYDELTKCQQASYDAMKAERDALNKQLAAAERCIDSISRVDDLPYTVHSIVDNYRNFEEAQ